jgi:pyruvate dehydrogenase E2 component (dihydrolipoamide acetyltransferase)
MPTPILMPALSPTMTEGKLAKWLKKEGDTIKSGDVLAEIETDKATMEVEAVDEGTLGRIVVPAGTENVAVNAPIAYMLNEGESASALDAIGKTTPAAPKPAAPAPTAPAPAAPAATPAPAAAPAPKLAAVPAPAAAAPVAASKDGQRIFASPLARRLAGEANLDLGRIQGSGPHGRIVKADVEGAKSSGVATAAPAAPSAPAPRPAAAALAAAAATPLPTEGFTELPLSTMRKVIARRLMESKQTIPHFYLTVEADIDALLALRTQLNAKAGEGVKLSVNDLVIKACGMALARVPRANAIWGGDKILLNKTCDVSVAVALDDGLITPIIRSVDKKGLAAISSEMKSLAERAKVGKLLPEEYQGGAFSLSNLGMFGIKEFAAVINPPQGSILAVGKGEQRAVVKGGALAVATMMSCTISCDHRVIDGAIGAQFLDAIKKLLEDPITMML